MNFNTRTHTPTTRCKPGGSALAAKSNKCACLLSPTDGLLVISHLVASLVNFTRAAAEGGEEKIGAAGALLFPDGERGNERKEGSTPDSAGGENAGVGASFPLRPKLLPPSPVLRMELRGSLPGRLNKPSQGEGEPGRMVCLSLNPTLPV